MKILVNIRKYDYGIKERGYSFEYDNFYRIFKDLGHDLYLFDFPTEEQKYGKEKMGLNLLKAVDKYKPDLIFNIFHPGDFNIETMEKLKAKKIKSVIWMTDDEWLWEIFSKNVSKYFDYVMTTDDLAMPKYRKIGYKKAILSQWGVNTSFVKKLKVKKDIDVSFVGQYNSWRKYLIDYLKKKGIDVKCYGTGWPNGRVSFEELNEIFNRSKITLNMSNSVQYDLGYLLSVSPTWNRKLGFKQNIFNLSPLVNTILSGKKGEHVKGRFFEAAGSGSFLLSYYVDSLKRFFVPDKEIITYKDKNDLVKKIHYYLKHEKEREKIAKITYEKAVKLYSYKKILKDILQKVMK